MIVVADVFFTAIVVVAVVAVVAIIAVVVVIVIIVVVVVAVVAGRLRSGCMGDGGGRHDRCRGCRGWRR